MKHAIRGFSKVRLAETLLWSQTDTHREPHLILIWRPMGAGGQRRRARRLTGWQAPLVLWCEAVAECPTLCLAACTRLYLALAIIKIDFPRQQVSQCVYRDMLTLSSPRSLREPVARGGFIWFYNHNKDCGNPGQNCRHSLPLESVNKLTSNPTWLFERVPKIDGGVLWSSFIYPD